MKYSANIIEMISAINHFNVAKYLRELGWQEIKTKREYVRIFQLNSHGFFQVNLPMDKSLIDYKEAMITATENIALAYGKTLDDIVLELLNPMSDILKIRVKNESYEAGNIFIEDAITLYNNAKKLLAATAMDIISPSLIHRSGRYNNTVEKFISSCRFGQTEIGSYVVSLVCPFTNISTRQLSLFEQENEGADSLARQVTNKLMASLKAVTTAIYEDELNESYLSNQNISSNFLESLAAMGIYKKDTELGITLKYCPTVTKGILDYNHVKINSDFHPIISSVVNRIKRTIESEHSIVGLIRALDAVPDIEKRTDGNAKIIFINADGDKETATVNFKNEDYIEACDAHIRGKNVKILGTISGQKGSRKIKCSSFEIIE